MKIKIWNERDQSPKRFVRFGKHPSWDNLIAWIVDENGERVGSGNLLEVTNDGALHRYVAVNRQEAKLAGIQLDDEGRWKLA